MGESIDIESLFGENVFTIRKMKEYLPKNV